MKCSDIRKVKYIKLGKAGGFEEACLNDGFMRIGYSAVPHEVALKGDVSEISDIYIKEGRSKATVTSFTNNIVDFYHDDEHTLWITFANGFLYWCTANPQVSLSKGDGKVRECIGGWSNCSLTGKPLRVSELSGTLTKTAGYRGTICSIEGDVANYVMRKIKGEELPLISKLNDARGVLQSRTADAIKLLQPNDFELLVDLIFAQNQWQRVGYVGSTQKTVDMEIVQPFMDYRAFVQVKSNTSQSELDEYVESFKKRDDNFMFYVYHSAQAELVCNEKGVRLIGCDKLAELVIESNLLDWIMAKIG
ncbi:MAG: hypothetical protein CFH43_00586 [Proteobacteria bacterium]|nr:MAG: hypothetical protein CFH43_00586 [Pseudomonadota bacterium]